MLAGVQRAEKGFLHQIACLLRNRQGESGGCGWWGGLREGRGGLAQESVRGEKGKLTQCLEAHRDGWSGESPQGMVS